MRAALYIRVSTDEQAAEGYSLDAQEQILMDYCIAEEWEPVRVFRDDGYSGRSINRPAYREMMASMDDWDLLLVLKMDRIHRNSRNFMNMMDELDRNGKMFVSSTESLDTTNAFGRFVVDMIQRIAQLESEQIGERTYIGMREKAETLAQEEQSKGTMGFNPPFGFCIEHGQLASVPDEQEVVGAIFRLCIGGDPVDTIAYKLNRDGTLTRRGNPWNKYNIRNILHNPVYAGYMRWDGILLPHMADSPVSPEDYNHVQDMLRARTRGKDVPPAEHVPTTRGDDRQATQPRDQTVPFVNSDFSFSFPPSTVPLVGSGSQYTFAISSVLPVRLTDTFS
jgi:site-specific DNA recombinase